MIHFVVHEPGDVVGVVVVEGVKAGNDLTGWVMDGDTTLNIKSESDIPIGHKISLKDLKVGDTVMWDNRTSLHRATPYDPYCGRMMHRTIIKGGEAWESRAD